MNQKETDNKETEPIRNLKQLHVAHAKRGQTRASESICFGYFWLDEKVARIF